MCPLDKVSWKHCRTCSKWPQRDLWCRWNIADTPASSHDWQPLRKMGKTEAPQHHSSVFSIILIKPPIRLRSVPSEKPIRVLFFIPRFSRKVRILPALILGSKMAVFTHLCSPWWVVRTSRHMLSWPDWWRWHSCGDAACHRCCGIAGTNALGSQADCLPACGLGAQSSAQLLIL